MKLKFILITLFALCTTKYYTQVFDWGKIEGLWAYDYGYGTTVDNNGNIYVTGKYEQQANFSGTIINNRGNHDVFLSKYDPNGNLIWIKTAGGALGDYGTSLSCDGNSYVYLAGEMEGYGIPISFDNSNITFNTVGDNDMFFAKYDLSGNLIWAKHAGAYKNDKALGITYDKLGNVIICGLFVDTTIFEGNNYLFGKGDKDIFFAKFDSSGNYLWGKSAGSPHRDEAKSVICDTAGNIYVTGMFSDTVDFGGINLISANGYFDMFIAKYDPSGNLIWVKQGSSDYDEVGWGITITNDEKIVVTGEFNAYALFENQALTTTGMSDVFIAAYNNNGTLAWLNSAGGPLIERARAIGTDGSHIYITGQFGGTCNFGNNQLIASDSSDVFITALDNNGNFIWSTRISGIQDSTENLGYESGNSICAFAGDGSVYATGAVLDGGTFDQTNINGYKRTDIFICKIHTEIPNSTIEINPTKFLKINNPCYNYLELNTNYDIKYNSLKLYDAYGKIVSQNFETDEEHKFRIDLTGIQSGIYFIQLKTDNISIIKKIIHLTTQ